MKNIFKYRSNSGFTLVELMVVIGIIGILASIVYASFGSSRSLARDEVRKTSVKDLELAIRLYKAQNGTYPAQGCGTGTQFAGPGSAGSSGYASCANYITGLTPDFIAQLPTDPSSEEGGVGFFYRSDGTNYKLIVLNSVETKLITSYNDEFARCPSAGGVCPATAPTKTYGVYSAGATGW